MILKVVPCRKSTGTELVTLSADETLSQTNRSSSYKDTNGDKQKGSGYNSSNHRANLSPEEICNCSNIGKTATISSRNGHSKAQTHHESHARHDNDLTLMLLKIRLDLFHLKKSSYMKICNTALYTAEITCFVIQIAPIAQMITRNKS